MSGPDKTNSILPCMDHQMRLREKNYYEIMGKRYFVLCELCYWCASVWGVDQLTIKCPVCDNCGRIESIIISNEQSR